MKGNVWYISVQRLLMGIRHRQTFKILYFFLLILKQNLVKTCYNSLVLNTSVLTKKKIPLETRRFRMLCPVPPIRALLLAYTELASPLTSNSNPGPAIDFNFSTK